MKKGDIVVKVIEGAGFRTCTFQRVKAVKAGVAYLGDGRKPDDINAFDAKTGDAKVNYISGFYSYLVTLDDGEERLLKTDEIE